MWTPDYFVRYLPFPLHVHALVQPNEDGSFDIYVNEHFDESRRIAALEHELEHIRRDHFYSDITLAQKEAEAGSLVMLVLPDEPAAVAATAAMTEGMRELRIFGSPDELLANWLKSAKPEEVKFLYHTGSAAQRLRP